MRTRRLGAGGALAVLAFAVLAFALLLAACGGGGGGNGVASAGGQSASQSNKGGKGKPTKAEKEEAGRKFAQCMREHGIDIPDPKFDENGGPVVFNDAANGGGQGQPPADQQKLEQANKDCEHFMKGVVNGSGRKPDPAEQKKIQEQALAFAKCMREHGIDFPDPQFGENGEMTQAVRINDGDSQQFQQAQDACKQYAPDGAITNGAPGGGAATGGSK